MNWIVRAMNGGMGWINERAPGLMPVTTGPAPPITTRC